MLDSFVKLFELLTERQRRDFFVLQVLLILTAFAELIGVASIMPFMAVAATPELISTNAYLNKMHVIVGEPRKDLFLIYIGLVFIGLVFLSNALLLLSQFLMSRYSHRLGAEFSVSIYKYYLNKNMLFHNAANSADLIQHIMRDTRRICTHMVAPALRLNGRIFSIILLSLLVIIVDVTVAAVTILCLSALYWFVFYVVRSRIYDNGKYVSSYNALRNKLLNESLEGIKDIKLYEAEGQMITQYKSSTRKVSKALAENMILGQSPYYLVETLVLVGTLIIALYFISMKGGLEAVLPILTLYCMAGFKLIPKVQQSYLAITQIRSAQHVFNSLFESLKEANRERTTVPIDSMPLVPQHGMALSNVSFTYPTGEEPVLRDAGLTINVGDIVAITGRSGTGKSTLLEIFMGLIMPDSGSLQVDGRIIDEGNIAGWRKSVGFVPQTVYLTDASIAENIAFGIAPEDIDMNRVRYAARLAAVAEHIESLPKGYETHIGERGVLLSGGQRQRLGIARALYRDISVLVLDEATSALDNHTQEEIFRKLISVSQRLTIVLVTHRKETLRFSSRIFELSHGRLVEYDTAPGIQEIL